MTHPFVVGSLIALVLGSGAGSAAAQAFVLRDERPIRSDVIFPDGWPNGDAVAILGTELHRWTGETWMPVVQLPAPFPPPIADIAYDRQRDQAICIAYLGNSLVTYTIDGNGFQAVPVATPNGVLLEYDPSLGAVMLFTGGAGNTQDYFWQGSWVPLPANVRPFDVTINMTADLARSRLVAFTPAGAFSPGGQTYEWDGTGWALLTPAASPPPRNQAAMTFDPISNRVLLFGGRVGATNFTDTWAWDGVNWVSIPTVPNPVPVPPFDLAFDRQSNAVVLLQGSGEAEADYRWNGAGWTTLTRSRPKSSFQIANDWLSNVLVMHGGGATYRWDGLSWTSLQAGGPSVRNSPMAYDAISQRMVVFGGSQFVLVPPFFQALGDTWTFDGTVWTQQTAGILPPPRRNHALVAHLGSSGVVLFGGSNSTGAPLQDTWRWSGGSWTQLNLPVSPPGGACSGASGPVGADPFVLSGGQLWRFNGTWNVFSATLPGTSTYVVGTTPGGEPLLMSRSNSADPVYEWVAGTWVARQPTFDSLDTTAFDPLRGVTIGFAQGQRYVYAATPAVATTFGSPCGVPAPRMLPATVPALGTAAMRIDVDEVRGIAAFFAGFGTANQPIGGGCSVYIASPIALGLVSANANDIASLPLPIPSTPTLLGLTFHVQVASPQAGTPPLDLALSDRLTLTLGH